MDTDGRNITPNRFEIKGEHISFSYEKQKIIDDVSFRVPQGTTTAIVGPSGSGERVIIRPS